MLNKAFIGCIFIYTSYVMEFFMSFLIKLMKIQKHLSKQSLPEDRLKTRNRAGNDSKQQAYTHATVFNPTTLA